MPRTPDPRTRIPALDRLGPAESARLLPQLLERHPELRAEAEALALRMIAAVDPEDVAEAMEFAFSGIGPEEGGDAFCQAALAPFIEGLDRLLGKVGTQLSSDAAVRGAALAAPLRRLRRRAVHTALQWAARISRGDLPDSAPLRLKDSDLAIARLDHAP